MRYRRALIECHMRRAEATEQRRRVRAAVQTLDRQYRAAPALPLGVAALGGFLLGRHRPDWRPPRRAWSLAWRWGFGFLRGVL
ncbi:MULTISPECIES: hypothetical protein [Oleiagrimonas]|jgi:hypothetical protein|uniref:YqjK-like protein n=1 Tax=Oleiagrimonas citrea TaxID=1665687 RepID=A0A846ZRH6_9GAMM|nr:MULTISPECIES: hypothetical protein [Oleiagrimonas]NKZ40119.1 hypothetical protein [Oleiagrimonas citrea]RAP57091.1 hypothetical protein BTJ49_10965 [Oleiagrimonas sp. MCCC 1A03011]